jgi:hypothetical protein
MPGVNVPPASGGIRKPTDSNQINGPVYNPPRFAEYGGLRGPEKVKTSANHSVFDVGNPLNVSKPGGGRAK